MCVCVCVCVIVCVRHCVCVCVCVCVLKPKYLDLRLTSEQQANMLDQKEQALRKVCRVLSRQHSHVHSHVIHL